jgi:hypothetical protein
MLLAYAAEPLPSFVVEDSIVGLGAVFQQTPFFRISSPPSEVILPPETAVVRVTSDMATVVSSGTVGSLHPCTKIAREMKLRNTQKVEFFFIMIFYYFFICY